MKITRSLLIVSIVVMLSLTAIAQTNPDAALAMSSTTVATGDVSVAGVAAVSTSTNAPPVPAKAPETLKPLLELLGGKGTWITTVIAWFAAISMFMAPFAVWIRNKLADALNKAAKSSEEDDDKYLRSLLGNPGYKLFTFILNFANIRFPTLAELEHAIELEHAAAKEALAKAGVITSTSNLPIEPKV